MRSSVRLHVRRVGEATGELFLTGAAPASEANAVELYEGIARALSAHRASVFLERAHAPAPLHDALRAARARALRAHDLDPETPSLVLASGDPSLSVQLWAAVGSSVITVSARGRQGRLRDEQLLWLPGIAGRDASRAGAQQMLEHAEAALGQLGFGWSDVARTWIVLRRLLEWYGEMNGARTAFLTARGIGRDRPFPASTGVSGYCDKEECLLDVLAARGARVTALDASARQSPAFEYGSSFSRGMSVQLNAGELIFVSGTASLGRDGGTLHAGSPELQAIETLLAVAALLETRGARLTDIVSGAVFHASGAALEAYESACARLCLPELPLAPVRADICRKELVVEIEAIAIAPPRGSR